MRVAEWLRRLIVGADPEPVDGVEDQAVGAVLDEAAALVSGRVVEQLCAAGVPVPAWAWLNAMAHRPPDELERVARLAAVLDASPPIGALAVRIARVRGDREAITALQREVLFGAELALLADRATREPIDAALRALRSDRAMG